MGRLQDQPIARKALLLGIVPTVIAILLVIALSFAGTYVQVRNNVVADLDAEAALIADNVGVALAFNDRNTAAEMIRGYRGRATIERVCIFDGEGQLFASFTRTGRGCAARLADASTAPGEITREEVALVSSRLVGTVRVTGNLGRLSAWMHRQAIAGLITFVVGMLIALLLTRRLARFLTVPLQQLAQVADHVSATHDYRIRATKTTDDEVGRLVASFNSMLDEIQEHHDASAHLLEREQEASRLKDQFLAAVSHELRTPLNAILGWLQVIRTTRPDAETMDRALERLERNANSQARVVEDLIDISRVVTGKLRLRTAPVDLRQVVRAALDTIDSAVQSKHVTVLHRLPDEPCMVLADPDRLQQIIWNLVSNAVKFTPAEGRVSVTVELSGATVTATVSDDGIGISREFLPYVFDQFRQADGSMTREHGGLGLGLAIAKELAELHGGTLDASSEGRGRGSTFTLRLPRTTQRPADHSASAPAAAAPPLAGRRILAVDDDVDAVEAVAAGLRAAGAEVEIAASGADAVASWRSRPFDVLVCDLAMPGMDGFSVLERIRQMRTGNGFVAIALSAYTRPVDRRRSLDAGFDQHMGKPFDLQELIARITAG